ncbi:MAG TPA: Clp protease N-terminal domain-containing protein [Dermatophilaceae bacterium]
MPSTGRHLPRSALTSRTSATRRGPGFGRRLLPLTSGSRAVIKATVDGTRQAGNKRIETRQFLLALLDRERPDPAAELLRALGVDAADVRKRLGESKE